MEQIRGSMAAVAAHRGWHADGAEKNSIAGLERAVRGGVDSIENDIRRLGDGTIIVHHDATLAGVPLEQLDRSVLAHHPHIPTLDQWAKRAGELGATGLIEFKDGGYEREAMATLRRHMPDSRLQLMSFHADVVAKLRELAPEGPVGLLSRDPATSADELVRNARAAGASFLGLNISQASEPVLRAADGAGLGVAVWTVDRSEDIARLLADRRVNTVITDAPRLALDLRGALHGATQSSLGVRLLRAATLAR
ncbi:MAG: glycerophosphoryl diester phosphodiesterase family protein [Thermoleophilia bacterium]|nr:glycerophosphoryl diester phosphodiesterase family protein [Thermoleophilia bacterium]